MDSPRSEQGRWFTEEVLPHGADLRSYLRRAFPAVRDVDDVVQESFVRMWTARASQPIRSARGFLFRIAQHLALDQVRRTRVSPVVAVGDLAALSVVEDRPDAAEALSSAEKIQLLAAAVASLPPRCREIIMLRKLDGFSQREVAARLGLSERTIEVQVARGVKRCERFLRDRGIHGFCDDSSP